ncbi:thymidylate synthase [Salinibaculum rarum]|uniref:thymidylate synthase n=1 Tax=Salinibaculum rarum TaxID=3058903 RepID=UPI00265F5163|nr:thymidylate synthase [Salinibaculum sp. KK48]
MHAYLDLVEDVLTNGQYKENRTAVDTISTFSQQYEIDVGDTYPLLTTKQMDTFRWDSMRRELEWYLSGAHHIRELTKDTGIWDAWADDNGNLETAYGRFWRRFPVPDDEAHLPGEAWPGTDCPWVKKEHPLKITYRVSGDTEDAARNLAKTRLLKQCPDDLTLFPTNEAVEYDADQDLYTFEFLVSVQGTATETQEVHQQVRAALSGDVEPYSYKLEKTVHGPRSYLVYDQLGYIVDTLNGDNPNRSANSRRLMVTPWNPGNAGVSKLPPCHAFWGVNVQGDSLNLHLTQRSGDIALGVPFNIAAYTAILKILADLTDFKVGTISHTIMDAHLYCGEGDRGAWYADNLPELQERVQAAENAEDYREIRSWILNDAPEDTVTPPAEDTVDASEHIYGGDHIPGLLEQLARDPYDKPTLAVDTTSLDEFTMDNIELQNYESHTGLKFGVAE